MNDGVLARARQADEVLTSFGRYLEMLPAADWEGPSDCAGWSVVNVAAHLVLVEDLLGTAIERGLAGDGGPRPEIVADVAGWRQRRAQEIQRLSGLPRLELLSDLRTGLGRMNRGLEQVAEAGAGGSGWHPSAGTQPLAWFAGQWLYEVALHDWDVRVAQDPSAEIDPRALPSLGAEMCVRMARCYQPAPGLAGEGIVRIALTGAPPVSWLARLANGKLEVADDSAAEPAATIESDPGTYALVQTARRPAGAFEARGRWRVVGDRELADGLTDAFKGV